VAEIERNVATWAAQRRMKKGLGRAHSRIPQQVHSTPAYEIIVQIDVNSSGISEAIPAYASNLAIRITLYCFRLRHFALWHDSRLDLVLRWPTALILCRHCLLLSTA
jgi:hypothetical protein